MKAIDVALRLRGSGAAFRGRTVLVQRTIGVRLGIIGILDHVEGDMLFFKKLMWLSPNHVWEEGIVAEVGRKSGAWNWLDGGNPACYLLSKEEILGYLL